VATCRKLADELSAGQITFAQAAYMVRRLLAATERAKAAFSMLPRDNASLAQLNGEFLNGLPLLTRALILYDKGFTSHDQRDNREPCRENQ
jgi:hypothetical protein